jgi:hypothetical protein
MYPCKDKVSELGICCTDNDDNGGLTDKMVIDSVRGGILQLKALFNDENLKKEVNKYVTVVHQYLDNNDIKEHKDIKRVIDEYIRRVSNNKDQSIPINQPIHNTQPIQINQTIPPINNTNNNQPTQINQTIPPINNTNNNQPIPINQTIPPVNNTNNNQPIQINQTIPPVNSTNNNQCSEYISVVEDEHMRNRSNNHHVTTKEHGERSVTDEQTQEKGVENGLSDEQILNAIRIGTIQIASIMQNEKVQEELAKFNDFVIDFVEKNKISDIADLKTFVSQYVKKIEEPSIMENMYDYFTTNKIFIVLEVLLAIVLIAFILIRKK